MTDSDRTDDGSTDSDRPATVEELMTLLEECHAELARDGTISPLLLDAPGEIERLVDEALDSQLGEREREQLRKRVEVRGEPVDTALRAVLADGEPVADGGQVCQHIKCDDPATEDIALENGRTAHLCEDHAHMNVDGTPVDGYEPSDPSKFNSDGTGGMGR